MKLSYRGITYSLRNLNLLAFNPITVGYEYCEPSHSFGPIARGYTVIHYVKSGKGVFTRGENRYDVSAGSCFVIRPGEVTFYEADNANPWHYIWIGFTANELPEFLSNDIFDASFAEDLFDEIEEKLSYYNSEKGDGGIREAFVCGKISEIIARFQVVFSKKKVAKSEMDIAKNYIDTSFANDIKISDLANLFHFESSYFSRAFKKRFGISPQNYLIKKRLSEATTLMQVHGFSPTSAANAVGYTDISLFSKMYKRYYGISPRAARRRLNAK